MSNVLSSKKIRTVLFILGGLILLFVVFGLGVAVGYDRAGFAAGLDDNYYRVFYGASPGGPMGMMPPTATASIHGVVGKVIDLGTSTVSVENQQGSEESVVVSPGVDIRNGNTDVAISGMAVGDTIAVIGEPNGQGQIVARFIRIFSAPSSTQN